MHDPFTLDPRFGKLETSTAGRLQVVSRSRCTVRTRCCYSRFIQLAHLVPAMCHFCLPTEYREARSAPHMVGIAKVQYAVPAQLLFAPTQGVLLDQFGVLHDGKIAFPEALEAVQQWAADGMQLYILSNSSRRASVALHKINNLGFPRECFAGVAPEHLCIAYACAVLLSMAPSTDAHFANSPQQSLVCQDRLLETEPTHSRQVPAWVVSTGTFVKGC